METLYIDLPPQAILQNPLLNKGTAFPQEERDLFGLNGFLPVNILDVETQIERSYDNFLSYRTPLNRYLYLMGIFGRNELLFYQLVARHVTEMLPIIYTPTVGEAAINYSKRFFEQRGLYLSYPLADKIDSILDAYPQKEVEVIVVTDGERILGLGDQGIGGMVIPIGKLALYTLMGGIHPAKTLPIFLDVGTHHPELLQDPKYLGWRHPRVVGKDYDAFIDRFVQAVRKRFPNVLLQWEDFGKDHARDLLDRYRSEVLSFNDDIQGTSAVCLAAILSAVRVSQTSMKEQTFLILGGGSAGIGIADGIVFALIKEGLSPLEAYKKVYIVDREGLIHEESPHIYPAQTPYVKKREEIAHWSVPNPSHISLLDVAQYGKATVLIGVSAQGGAFTKEVIEAMSAHTPLPIVLPLSNPTAKAECTPEELISWTRGKVLFATGSPFAPVRFGGGEYQVAQCNNVYIFPGVGMGALAAKAHFITDGMFLEASYVLSRHSPRLHDPKGSLFPSLEEVRKVSQDIALAVGKKAIEEGASLLTFQEVEENLKQMIWEPAYPKLRKASS